MTLDQIAALIAQFESGDAPALVHQDDDGSTLLLSRIAGEGSASGEPRDFIRAPAAGVVRLAHPLGGVNVLKPGARVHTGEIVGFIQAGPVLRPVSGRSGVVRELLARDGDVVGFGAAIGSVRIEHS